MADATFTFRVDDELKARFAEVARAHDRSGAQLLRDFMREYVRNEQAALEYDAWFRGEVRQGLKEADDPSVRRRSNDEVRTGWRQQRALLARRAG